VTVTDAQTRKNLVALLVAAKAVGQQIQVDFDNTGDSVTRVLWGSIASSCSKWIVDTTC
jgi:hypothetical protein